MFLLYSTDILLNQASRLGRAMCDKYLATCLDQLISIEQTCKCENAAGWMIHSHLGAQRTDGLMGFGSDSELPADLQIILLLSICGREWVSQTRISFLL